MRSSRRGHLGRRRERHEHGMGARELQARAERFEILDRPAGLVDRRLGTPEPAHHPRQFDPRAAGLERRPASLEQIDGVFEVRPRRFGVAGRAPPRVRRQSARARACGAVRDSSAMASSSAAAAAASSIWPCSTQARTFSSSAAMRSVRLVTGRRRRCRSARSALPVWSPRSNITLARPIDRQRMSPHPLEERHGFVELPLAAAQLAEPHEPLPRHRRTAGGELVGRGGELVLGFVPRPAPHADRRVLGAADGEQRPEPHL